MVRTRAKEVDENPDSMGVFGRSRPARQLPARPDLPFSRACFIQRYIMMAMEIVPHGSFADFIGKRPETVNGRRIGTRPNCPERTMNRVPMESTGGNEPWGLWAIGRRNGFNTDD